jgi:dihydroflavonol-4-reductase
MPKVLVTGGNGFLGSNLTRALFREGYEVKIMVRHHADLKGLSDIPCELFFGNIDNREHVNQAVAGCDMVVHAAAITDQWNITFETYERINITGTKHVVEACLEQGVQKLVYVSTANTIGPGSKEDPGTELNAFTLFNANSGYINTKYLAQQYVLEQVDQRKLPAVVINPTFMIGPHDVKPSSGKLLLHGIGKKILFYPPGGKNFVAIQDVCQGVLQAIKAGKAGECYLLAGYNLSYKEFFALVDQVSGHKRLLIQVPTFVLKLAGAMGSLKEKLTGRPGRLTLRSAYLLCLPNYYSGKKATRELSVTYTPIADTINKALMWFKEHNYY